MLFFLVQISRVFLELTETMRNSDNELVKFVMQRSDMYIIASNIGFIKCANLCDWDACNLPSEELSKVEVIKELIFVDNSILSHFQ